MTISPSREVIELQSPEGIIQAASLFFFRLSSTLYECKAAGLRAYEAARHKLPLMSKGLLS